MSRRGTGTMSREGTPPATAKHASVPDLSSMLLRKSLSARTRSAGRCSGCERTPLTGERLHEMDTGRLLCDLCLARLPEEERRAVRSERVGASERRLSVVPKAA